MREIDKLRNTGRTTRMLKDALGYLQKKDNDKCVIVIPKRYSTRQIMYLLRNVFSLDFDYYKTHNVIKLANDKEIRIMTPFNDTVIVEELRVVGVENKAVFWDHTTIECWVGSHVINEWYKYLK